MKLQTAFRITTRVVPAIVAFLAVLAGFEVLRIFVFLYRIQPHYGWSFFSVIALGVVAVVVYIFNQIKREPSQHPRLLDPLPAGDVGHRQWKRHANHRMHTLSRWSNHPELGDESRVWLEDELDTLDGLLHHHPLNEDLRHIIRKCDEEILPQLVDELQQPAESIWREPMRQSLMASLLGMQPAPQGIASIPPQWSTTNQIIHLCIPAASLRTQWGIYRDIALALTHQQVAATERLLLKRLYDSSIPASAIKHDLGAALVNGLRSGLPGTIAFVRSTSHLRWTSTRTPHQLDTAIQLCLCTLKAALQGDVLSVGHNRLLCGDPPESMRTSGFWDRMQKDLALVIDSTLHELGQETIQPRRAPETGRMQSRPARGRAEAEEPGEHQGARRRRVKRRRGIARVIHTFGQRVKYTMGLGRR